MSLSTIELPRAGAVPPKALRQVQSAMKRDGAVVLDGLFPPALLKKLSAEVRRRHGSGQLRERGLVRDIAGRYAAVLPFEGPFLDSRFYANPALHKMLAALLGSDYRISSLETVIASPGAYEQHQHIDGPIRFDVSLGKSKKAYHGDLSGLPPYAVTLCVPLCDVAEDNGPTAIWAGSHRTALNAKPPSEACIRRDYREEHVVGRLGRAFFFDYRVFHCGMPNMTPEVRPVLMFVFTRAWFRDQNLCDVYPRVVISKRNLSRVPRRYKDLFLLAPSSRRPLWD